MTPIERAERIVVELSGQTFSAEGEGNAWLAQKIVAAIREAVDEGMVQQMRVDMVYKNQCVVEAYVDAAEIVEEHAQEGCDILEILPIADKIRARIKTIKEPEWKMQKDYRGGSDWPKKE